MLAYRYIKSERFCDIVGVFVEVTGRFCEIIYTINIILQSIGKYGDIFKCVHISGLNGILKDIVGFVCII